MKKYATFTHRGIRYAAHMDEGELHTTLAFSDVREISKSEYREARRNGMPSWGETEIAKKMYA